MRKKALSKKTRKKQRPEVEESISPSSHEKKKDPQNLGAIYQSGTVLPSMLSKSGKDSPALEAEIQDMLKGQVCAREDAAQDAGDSLDCEDAPQEDIKTNPQTEVQPASADS